MKTTNKIKLFLAFLALLNIQCTKNSKSSSSPLNKQQAKPFPVEVLEYKKATLELNFPTIIRGLQDIEIRPKIEGFIQEIHIDEGSYVKKGQLLFSINAPQYEQNVLNAKAAVTTAKANLENAKMQVKKLQPLVEKGITGKYQLESSKYELESSYASLNQAQTTLKNAEINLSYTKILSPVNGNVGSLPFRLGSLVNSNNVLTTISNTSEIYAYFSMGEKELSTLLLETPGNSTEEKIKNLKPVELYLANGQKYEELGRIETIGGQINTSTGSVSLRAKFKNKNQILKSGGSSTIKVFRTIDQAIIIPQQATFEMQGTRFVYLLHKNNKVEQKTVKVEPLPDGKNFVALSGLNVSDTLVVSGVQNLSEGLEILPIRN